MSHAFFFNAISHKSDFGISLFRCSGLQIQDDGTVVPSELSTAPLLCRASGHGDDKERVSTGTKYALEQWLLLKCKSGSKV